MMNKQSENESSEDDLSDGETLKTADASGVERPRINSTTEEEIRANILTKDEPKTNEKFKAKLSEVKIMQVKTPGKETTLDWNMLIEEEEILENNQRSAKP